jgi:hypothetical protein
MKRSFVITPEPESDHATKHEDEKPAAQRLRCEPAIKYQDGKLETKSEDEKPFTNRQGDEPAVPCQGDELAILCQGDEGTVKREGALTENDDEDTASESEDEETTKNRLEAELEWFRKSPYHFHKGYEKGMRGDSCTFSANMIQEDPPLQSPLNSTAKR